MTHKNTLLLFLFLLAFTHVSSQSNSVAIIKEYYPLIYTSIKQEAEKQWANDKMVLNAIMEGQAKAFIEIAENQSEIDATAMADALLFGSLENQTEYNRSIIDELSIANPYPLLRCNWYKVNEQYKKTKKDITSQNNSVERNINSTKPVQESKYKDEIYDTDKSQKIKKAKTTSIIERKFYEGGTSLDLIYSNITGLNEWSENANPGMGLELRLWGRQPFGKAFFAMAEVSVNFIHHFIEDSYNYTSGNLNQTYMKTTLLLGAYQHLSPTTTFIFGLGGFSGMNYSNTSADYRNEEDAYPSSEDLKTFNYGFSGLVGIQYKRCELALRGDWGMADLSLDDFNFKSRTISLSVGYIFGF